MAEKRYIVGVDAGGTGIRAALAEVESGSVIGEAEAPSDPDGGPGPLAELLPSLLAGIPSGQVGTIVAGITKVSRAGVKEGWDAYLRSTSIASTSVACVPDYVIAFHGALPGGVGLSVVAGTGSVVYGENRSGHSVRVGGRGWEFGDEGSGAWLTTEMVRRTLRALDGIETPTPMTRAVCDFLATYEPASLGESARREALASGRGFLAPLALSLARDGNLEAKNLFIGAGGWLAAHVRAAAARLQFLTTESVDIAMMGGLCSAGPLLTEPFGLVVRRYLPAAIIIVPESRPLLGAVRMALRAARNTPIPPFRSGAE